MARVVNVHEAKTHLSRLLDEVQAGEEIVIAKAGKPYARLTPIENAGKRPLGFMDLPGASDAILEPLPPEELARWEDPSSGPEMTSEP